MEAIRLLAPRNMTPPKAVLLAPLLLLLTWLQARVWVILTAAVVWVLVGPVEWIVRMTMKGAMAA